MSAMTDASTDADHAYNLSLAKKLAHSSDAGIRDRTVRLLATWLSEHATASELEYLKLWKALFYCVWYSDKVPVQQELVFTLSRLVRQVEADLPRALLFLRAFFATMQREWLGLDRYRLDKFLSLIRRVVSEALRLVAVHSYAPAALEGVAALFADSVLGKEPNGVRYHVTDVFLDEVCATLPAVTAPQLWTLLRGFTLACQAAPPGGFIVHSEFTQRVLQEVLHAAATKIIAAHSETDAPMLEPVKMTFPGLPPDDHRLVMLSQDATDRQAARAIALKQVNVAAFAKELWTLAASRELQSGIRKKLYELHGVVADAAVSLGHAKTLAGTKPKGAAEPLPLASSVAAGGKRQRADEAPAEKGRKKAKGHTPPAAAPADDPEDVDLDDALAALPTVEQLRGSDTAVKSKPIKKRRVSGSAASAAVDVVPMEAPAPVPAEHRTAVASAAGVHPKQKKASVKGSKAAKKA